MFEDAVTHELIESNPRHQARRVFYASRSWKGFEPEKSRRFAFAPTTHRSNLSAGFSWRLHSTRAHGSRSPSRPASLARLPFIQPSRESSPPGSLADGNAHWDVPQVRTTSFSPSRMAAIAMRISFSTGSAVTASRPIQLPKAANARGVDQYFTTPVTTDTARQSKRLSISRSWTTARSVPDGIRTVGNSPGHFVGRSSGFDRSSFDRRGQLTPLLPVHNFARLGRAPCARLSHTGFSCSLFPAPGF
jgi:hypothetical protein